MVTALPEGHGRLVGRSEVFVSEGGGAAGEIGAGLKEDLTYVLKDVRPVFLTTPIFLPFSFPTQRDIVWATAYPLNTLSSTISSSSKCPVGRRTLSTAAPATLSHSVLAAASAAPSLLARHLVPDLFRLAAPSSLGLLTGSLGVPPQRQKRDGDPFSSTSSPGTKGLAVELP